MIEGIQVTEDHIIQVTYIPNHAKGDVNHSENMERYHRSMKAAVCEIQISMGEPPTNLLVWG
jgi:hypothetical protein